jgi:hypothetical protein
MQNESIHGEVERGEAPKQAYELEDLGARDDAPYREILRGLSLSAGLYLLPVAYSLA